jgi:xylulokinase
VITPADALDRDILVVVESHLPAVGAAAMCSEVLDGHVIDAPAARRVSPRTEWRDTVATRWHEFRRAWSMVTGVPPLGTLDDAVASIPS